jgi:hypothetical protein
MFSGESGIAAQLASEQSRGLRVSPRVEITFLRKEHLRRRAFAVRMDRLGTNYEKLMLMSYTRSGPQSDFQFVFFHLRISGS